MSKVLNKVTPFPHSIYTSLIKPMRDADKEADLFLQRFLQGPQEVWESIYNKIGELAKIQDPELAPVDALPLLKKLVGFSGQYDTLTGEFTENELRKLLLLAIPIWKQKGSEKGLLAAVRLLVAVDPLLFNWFFHQFIIGESYISEDWVGTDIWILDTDGGAEEPFESRLMVFDDGTLDRDLLVNVLNLFRVPSERVNITYHPFLESFDLDWSQWAVKANSPNLSVESGVGEIRPTSPPWVLDTSPVVDDTGNHSVRIKLRYIEDVPGPASRVIIGTRFKDKITHWDGVGIRFHIPNKTIEVGYITYISPTTVTFSVVNTFNDWELFKDTWYTFTLEVEDDGTDIYVQLFIDRDQVFREVLAGQASTYPDGSVVLSGRDMDLDVDFVHVTPIPVETDRVEP